MKEFVDVIKQRLEKAKSVGAKIDRYPVAVYSEPIPNKFGLVLVRGQEMKFSATLLQAEQLISDLKDSFPNTAFDTEYDDDFRLYIVASEV